MMASQPASDAVGCDVGSALGNGPAGRRNSAKNWRNGKWYLDDYFWSKCISVWPAVLSRSAKTAIAGGHV